MVDGSKKLWEQKKKNFHSVKASEMTNVTQIQTASSRMKLPLQQKNMDGMTINKEKHYYPY